MSRRIAVVLALLVCVARVTAAEPFGGTGAHFFILQEVVSQPREASEQCRAAAGALTLGVASVREAEVASAIPSVTTGEVPEGGGGQIVGSLTVCFDAGGARSTPAGAFVRLLDGAHELPVEAQGDCQPLETDSADLHLQACALSVLPDMAPGIRGGLLTSTGLIAAGEPARTKNAHLWTLYLIRE